MMVGDSYANDMEAGTAAGVETLWLLHEPVRELPYLVGVVNGSLPSPTLTLRSLADVDPNGPWLPPASLNAAQ